MSLPILCWGVFKRHMHRFGPFSLFKDRFGFGDQSWLKLATFENRLIISYNSARGSSNEAVLTRACFVRSR